MAGELGGRYRVSMLASGDAVRSTGTEHGIQAELPGPSLSDLCATVDALLPDGYIAWRGRDIPGWADRPVK